MMEWGKRSVLFDIALCRDSIFCNDENVEMKIRIFCNSHVVVLFYGIAG